MNIYQGVSPRVFITSEDFPIFCKAITEATNNLQTPTNMALVVGLAAVSLAVQGLVDVRSPIGRKTGTSLMILVVANSGERKSAMESVFFRSIREWDDKSYSNSEADSASYKKNFEVWKTAEVVKRRKLKKKMEKGECYIKEELDFQNHLDEMPRPPVQKKFLHEDATVPALLQGLKVMPTAGLISSEGGSVLGGPIFSEGTKLNAIWSGESVVVDRVSSESFTLTDVRLTTQIMVQPGLLQEFLAEKGERARSSGLLARMLVCNTGTTQGSRFIYNPSAFWGQCDRFNRRVSALIEENILAIQRPDFDRKVLKLSYQAEREWLSYYNFVESNIQMGGRYANAGDHASKLAENVARVAANLHYFEEKEGDISLETLKTSINIVDGLSFDFTNIFNPPSEFYEAKALDDWLTQKYRVGNVQYVAKSTVRRFCPNSLRSKEMLDSILDALERSGSIKIFRKNKTVFLDLFPGVGLRPI